MSYRLVKLKFGTSKVENIGGIEVDAEIKDFCIAKNYGYLYVCNNAVGLVGEDGVVNNSYVRGLNGAISITYSPYFHKAYIFEEGMNLKVLDVELRSISNFLGKTYQSKLAIQLANAGNCKVDSAIDSRGDIYAVNSSLHKCLMFRGSEFKTYIGRGKANYSVSNRIEECSLSSPSGIDYYSGSFYIADTGNHCIREIANGRIFVIAGSPLEGKEDHIVSPTKICVKEQAVYFVDRENIWCLTLSNRQCVKVYESPHIISIDIDDDRNLILVEKSNA